MNRLGTRIALTLGLAGCALAQTPSQVQLGVVSLERFVPGATDAAGVVGFRVLNLTGPSALPPEAPVTDTFLLTGATLTYTVQGAGPVTVALGDLAPGVSVLPASLRFADTTVFTAAEFRANLGTRLVTVGGQTLTLSPAAVVVPLTAVGGVLVPGNAVSPIVVSATPSQRLAFVQGPTGVRAGVVMTPAVTVRVMDPDNNTVATSSANVTLTSSPAGYSATVAAVNGIATFNAISFENSGTYTFTASANNIASATSGQFVIGAPAPSQLSFGTVPSGGVIGVALPTVTVRLLDARGNLTDSTANVRLTSSPAGIDVTRAAVNGVATFSGLVLNNIGNYTLNASSPGLTTTASTAFTVGTAAVGGVTVTSDRAAYSIGGVVTLRGRVTDGGGAGIPALPVVLSLAQQGATRTIPVTTANDGTYATSFTTTSADAGAVQVTATAAAGGVSRSATATFRVVGLLLTTPSPTVDVIMGATARPAFVLQNAGDGSLIGLSITATPSPFNVLTGRLNLAGVPTALTRGVVANFTLDLTASGGTPPTMPAVFTITASAIDSVTGLQITEVEQLTVTLRPATSSPVLSPLNSTLGVNPGSRATQQFSVRNDGFVAIDDARVEFVTPAAAPWVSFVDQGLGRLAPGQTVSFQLSAAPPVGTPVGSYTVPIRIIGGSITTTATMVVNVSAVTTGTARFNIVNDLGVNVPGATVTLISRANPAVTFQAATDAQGNVTMTGVTAGDYSFLVTAPGHSPAVGAARVSAGGGVQALASERPADIPQAMAPDPTPIQVTLSYDVVTLSFVVVPTSIVDVYETELRARYSTFLVKPVLRVTPPNLDYTFQPQLSYPPYPQCFTLEVENLHPTSPVTNVTLDSTSLDAAVPASLRFTVRLFLPNQPLTGPGSQSLNIGTLEGRNFRPDGAPVPIFKRSVVACGTVNREFLENRSLGNISVAGQYEYSGPDALGNVVKKIGTTATPVPVTYTFPEDVEAQPINLIHDPAISSNDLRPLDPTYPLYLFRSLREQTGQLLKPSNSLFGGRNLAAFAQNVTAPPALTRAKRNLATMLLNQPFWRANFFDNRNPPARPEKTSFNGPGDIATYDVSTNDTCSLDLVSCLRAALGDPRRRELILNRRLWVGTSVQWSDRGPGTALAGPDGYLAPINILRVSPTGSVAVSGAVGGPLPVVPLPRTCTSEYVPGEYVPVDCGQILIAIDFRNGLERQAFNASLGIAPAVPLNRTTAAMRVRNLDGTDATDQFTVIVMEDPQGATQGNVVSTPQLVRWQLIPKLGAGGTNGRQYRILVDFSYTVGGQAQAVQTAPVTITVAPQPQLQVWYGVPFVVVQKKPAKIRIRVQNQGTGPALNFNISSPEPIRVLARPGLPDNPQVPTNFTLVGASNTPDTQGYRDGVKEIEFGQIPAQSTSIGYFNLVVKDCLANPTADSSLWRRITNCGYIVDSTAQMKQQDFAGRQLDPLLLPPRVEFLPALGGTVFNNRGEQVGTGGLTVQARSSDGRFTYTDITDSDGGYFLQEMAPARYTVRVLSATGATLGEKFAEVLVDSSTDFLNFNVTPPNAGTARITLGTNPAGLAFFVDGVEYRTPRTFTWTTNSRHTFGLSRTQFLGAVTQTRYLFSGFSGGLQPSVATGPLAEAEIVTPAADTTYTASFATQHNVQIAVSPTAAGTVNGPSGFLNQGTTISLTASAATGYRFANWSGDVTGSTTPATLLVNGPKSVTANFAPLAPILTASIIERSGEPNARTWVIRLTNSGIGVAENPQLTAITIVPVGAPGCSVAPRLMTPLPVNLPTILSLGQDSAAVIADVAGCTAAQRFTITIAFRANGGAYASSTVLNNVFR